jgi:hypothetical protein
VRYTHNCRRLLGKKRTTGPCSSAVLALRTKPFLSPASTDTPSVLAPKQCDQQKSNEVIQPWMQVYHLALSLSAVDWTGMFPSKLFLTKTQVSEVKAEEFTDSLIWGSTNIGVRSIQPRTRSFFCWHWLSSSHDCVVRSLAPVFSVNVTYLYGCWLQHCGNWTKCPKISLLWTKTASQEKSLIPRMQGEGPN